VYKHLYRHFLGRHPGELHFTAHSHHFWPDVTREAHLQYWDDSACLVDGKWEYLYGEVIPELRRLIAEVIGCKVPEQIVFAPNTHEFVCRLLSCFDPGKPLAVLTSDSEFESFRRQLARFAEYPWVEVRTVPVEPISSFQQRFVAALGAGRYRFIFLSQVFFNSGYAISDLPGFMARLADEAGEDAVIALDGYHGFCALPTDIGPFCERAFYLAGGYKYAQAGEGVCFLHVPPRCRLRPANTGWFAQLTRLSEQSADSLGYPEDGGRFAGSTFDPSGVYRLRAVLRLFRELGLEIRTIHDHVVSLQARFIARLRELDHPVLAEDRLLYQTGRPHGHFLTFQLPSPEAAGSFTRRLRERSVHVDCRGSRVRFGFGLYHDGEDVEELCRRLGRLP
jgi:selenocysteine lyase/cysteine desulfurase